MSLSITAMNDWWVHVWVLFDLYTIWVLITYSRFQLGFFLYFIVLLLFNPFFKCPGSFAYIVMLIYYGVLLANVEFIWGTCRYADHLVRNIFSYIGWRIFYFQFSEVGLKTPLAQDHLWVVLSYWQLLEYVLDLCTQIKSLKAHL